MKANHTVYDVWYSCKENHGKSSIWNSHGHVTTLLTATPHAEILAVRFSCVLCLNDTSYSNCGWINFASYNKNVWGVYVNRKFCPRDIMVQLSSNHYADLYLDLPQCTVSQTVDIMMPVANAPWFSIYCVISKGLAVVHFHTITIIIIIIRFN